MEVLAKNPTAHLTLLAALAPLMVAAIPASAHDVMSNRHHLSCTQQSAPVIVPHTTASTVRLGLPAQVQGERQVESVAGYKGAEVVFPRAGIAASRVRAGAVTFAPPEPGC